MAKKKKVYRGKGRREDGDHGIDRIPKHSQGRRSPNRAKPRTDFSAFRCSSSPVNFPLPQDILQESCFCKNIQSVVTIDNVYKETNIVREIPHSSLSRITKPEDNQQEVSMNGVDIPIGQDACFVPGGDRLCINGDSDMREEISNVLMILELTPDKLRAAENSDECTTPGSAVWAKSSELWHHPADALLLKESFKLRKDLFESCDGPDCSNQDGSPGNSSVSSRAGVDHLTKGRSKRERKQKMHFDEIVFPPKSTKRVRRLRIMRLLGLAAPVGSPF